MKGLSRGAEVSVYEVSHPGGYRVAVSVSDSVSSRQEEAKPGRWRSANIRAPRGTTIGAPFNRDVCMREYLNLHVSISYTASTWERDGRGRIRRAAGTDSSHMPYPIGQIDAV